MIAAIFNVYLALLFVLVHFNIVRFNLFWKTSPVLVLLLLLVGLFIPMGWGAPQGAALVVRDVLFRIDPTPYTSQVDALEAQLQFHELRPSQMTQLQRAEVGRAFDVEQRQAEVDQLKGQIIGAKWNLEKTVVRAPADGYVTNLALRKGARVGNIPLAPVMAFIDTSTTIVGAEIQQIDARYIQPGQDVEVTFKFFPGEVFAGKVDAVLQAIATGQVQTSGFAAAPKAVQAAPLVVRFALDDPTIANRLPAGSAGDAAIFTDRAGATHVIRKVLLRQIAILNYINPF